MARQSERDAGIAYPQLHREQIAVIIGALMFYSENHVPNEHTTVAQDAAFYLINFHTRRWGLPRSIAARLRPVSGAR